jgi:hypothetical protein
LASQLQSLKKQSKKLKKKHPIHNFFSLKIILHNFFFKRPLLKPNYLCSSAFEKALAALDLPTPLVRSSSLFSQTIKITKNFWSYHQNSFGQIIEIKNA